MIMNKEKTTCNFCGHEIVKGAPFCSFCGEKIKEIKKNVFIGV